MDLFAREFRCSPFFLTANSCPLWLTEIHHNVQDHLKRLDDMLTTMVPAHSGGEESVIDHVLKADPYKYKLYPGHPDYEYDDEEDEKKSKDAVLTEETPLPLSQGSDSEPEDEDVVSAVPAVPSSQAWKRQKAGAHPRDEEDTSPELEERKEDAPIRRSNRAPQFNQRFLNFISDRKDPAGDTGVKKHRQDVTSNAEKRDRMSKTQSAKTTHSAESVFMLTREDIHDVREMLEVAEIVRPMTLLFEAAAFPTTPLIQLKVAATLSSLDRLRTNVIAQRVARHLRSRFAAILPKVRHHFSP